ncbi:MAG: hypothetical protein ABI417_12050 [Coleofasciculaceae cyanobacterium]
MNIIYWSEHKRLRPMAWLLSMILIVPFFTACSKTRDSAIQPPVDDTRTENTGQTAPVGQPPQAKKKGLSTGQKVAILGGAAALYYLYNKHKNNQAKGAQGKYYLSKNGRMYYRDEQNRAHWVTPPKEGIPVSESDAQNYREFQGYNNNTSGRTLGDVAREMPQSQLAPAP